MWTNVTPESEGDHHQPTANAFHMQIFNPNLNPNPHEPNTSQNGDDSDL